MNCTGLENQKTVAFLTLRCSLLQTKASMGIFSGTFGTPDRQEKRASETLNHFSSG